MGLRVYLYLALLSILWGASFFFIKISLRELTPLTIVLARVGFSAVILTFLVYASGKRMPSSPSIWGAFFVMGALNNMIPFSLIIWGQQHVESSIASIINATSPVFSVILAHFLTREEKMTPGRVAGVVLGLAGVGILIGFEGLHASGLRFLGQTAMLGATLCYASAAIYGRRFREMPPLVVASGVLTGATVMMIPLVLLLEKPFALQPGGITVAAMAGLTLLSTALAYVFYFKVLALTSPTNLLLVTFLIPVNAIVLGVVVLHESLEWNALVGMAFIFTGLAVTDGRLFRKKKPAN
jgi:drug/metabolite transporter (DMT)-like permease